MTRPINRIHSLLFVPATRPDRVAKLEAIAPDVGVIDLEDAVLPNDKDEARLLIGSAVAALRAHAPNQLVVVRVNAIGTPWHVDDVTAAAAADADAIVLPKAERSDDVAAIAARVGLRIIAGIETAEGVRRADEIAQTAGVVGMYFGAEDYIADVGGRRTDEGTEVLFARSRVVMAARLGGVIPIDQVVTSLGDDARFLSDAEDGRNLGYRGKICIHPSQVPLALQAFSPSDDEVAFARRIIAAVGDDGENGVVVLDGQMIDRVHLARARAVVIAAAPIEGEHR